MDKDIEQFEADLWETADNLRANSKLSSSDYFTVTCWVRTVVENQG